MRVLAGDTLVATVRLLVLVSGAVASSTAATAAPDDARSMWSVAGVVHGGEVFGVVCPERRPLKLDAGCDVVSDVGLITGGVEVGWTRRDGGPIQPDVRAYFGTPMFFSDTALPGWVLSGGARFWYKRSYASLRAEALIFFPGAAASVGLMPVRNLQFEVGVHVLGVAWGRLPAARLGLGVAF